MALKSKAQMHRFGEMVKQGKMTKEEFNKWVAATPNIKSLPDRVGERKIRSIADLKKVKVQK